MSELLMAVDDATESDLSGWKPTILSIIDKLRERKARPDVERIFIMASRQPEATSELTRDCIGRVLQQLVEERLVTPVEYKGSVSYRNACSWRRRKELAGGRNSPETSQRVLTAAEGFQGGSFTAQALHNRVVQSSATPEESGDSGMPRPMSPNSLAEALEREAAAGRLFRVGPGRFQLDLDGAKRQAALRRRKERMQAARAKARATAAAAATSASDMSASGTLMEIVDLSFPGGGNGPLDLSSRHGQHHQPHHQHQADTCTPETISCSSDSTTNDKPSQRQMQHQTSAASSAVPVAPANPPELCDFCLSPASANRMGVPEQLLRCRDCCHKAHPSCMQYAPELAIRASQSPWQCTDCKTCCVCSGSGEPHLMLICDACDKGYHLKCHRPSVTERPAADAKWVCSRCCAENAAGSQNCQAPSQLAANNPSQPDNHAGRGANGCGVALELPWSEQDASRWSVSQVRSWLMDEGFPLAAQAFVEQEIDGASLMLMKRMDVLTGLGLKLGPAVKVFEKISRLQYRCRTLLQVK